MEEKEKAAAEAALLAKVTEAAEKAAKAQNEAVLKEISEVKAALAEAKKNLSDSNDEVAKYAGEIKAIKEAGKNGPVRKSIKESIKEYLEKHKDDYENFTANKSNSFTFKGLNLKSAITMLESASVGGSAYIPTPQIMPGIVDLVRNQPLIQPYANGGTIGSAVLVWVNKFNAQGNAAITAEGAAKPLTSFELKSETSTARKVAAKEKVSTEMLKDIDYMAATIENEMIYKVDIAVDNGLIAGDGTGVNLKGITAYAGGYVNTNISTTTPNDFDAIRAGIGQLKSLNFTPSHVFFNPQDGANMDIVKDGFGRPLSKEYKTEDGQIFRVIPVESNQITAGSFLLADMSMFYVWDYLPMTIQYGWENDDFTKNLVTVIGERRLHCYIATNHTPGFLYDTFVNVKTAITAAP